ncbi:CaiB/BaiF CoA transferase family protein [Nocardia alni]|uniref:CaiB/BaiF CoA transferase family protein n=1 Tax=Nocardia alni TaxID=2815723 RepID=UPI001C23B277|nr:CaiB/BaiF CoA-transferase family protein [Nocardia alni]
MTEHEKTGGPLAGLRVVELAGIGPVPHAAMMLGDLGADVVHVGRTRGGGPDLSGGRPDPLLRNRRLVRVDLKDAADLELVRTLVTHADVLIEGLRPGATERLGLGPQECTALNPRLIYARMTGWGQTGPLASRAGHDINYIALTGILDAVGRAGQPPTVPLNLVGDFGGGSMFLLVGILAAVYERAASGRGQVIDAAMVDGASTLAQLLWALRGFGAWSPQRGANLLDGGAPYYDTYRCADDKYVAVGAIEPQFFAALVAGLGLRLDELPAQDDRENWPSLREIFTETFGARTRGEWTTIFESTDACVSPVLTFDEVAGDSYLRRRGTVIGGAADTRAAPAPRFSRTPAGEFTPPRTSDQREEILADWA